MRLIEPDAGCESNGESTAASPPPTLPTLEVVDEFHAYIKPKLFPALTEFCKTLTGISQQQVDDAGRFQAVLYDMFVWLKSHALIDTPEGVEDLSAYPMSCKAMWGDGPWHPIMQSTLTKDTAWVTHGAFDLLSFVPKSAWINGLQFGPPRFLRGPVIDIRKSVHGYLGKYIPKPRPPKEGSEGRTFHSSGSKDRKRIGTSAATDEKAQTPAVNGHREPAPPKGDGSIPGLLQSLGMDEFQGKLHCGLDDTRNIARILIEIGRIVMEGLLGDQGGGNDDDDKAATSAGAESSTAQPPTQQMANVKIGDATEDTDGKSDGKEESKPPSQSASSIPLPPSRPPTPPPSTLQLLQSLLQPNLSPYEYPPLPRLLSEEERQVMNDPKLSTLTDSDRRLLKGGGRFYPRRYDWMGKKVGVVKWEPVDERAADASEHKDGGK